MARKKKKRGSAQSSPVFAWILLAGSLGVIGYACSHKETARATHSAAPRIVAHATPAAEAEPPLPSVPPAPAVSPTPASPAAKAVGTPLTPAATTAPTLAPVAPVTASPAAAATSARLAIIIDDCGQWPDTERGFIALPVALTLSVLPEVRYNRAISQEASDAHKGVMLHLPMETISGINPGSGKVTTEMDDAAIAAQVERDLADVSLASGVNNHEGSKATADTRVMNAVASVLASKGDFFIDSRTNAKTVAQTVAREHGVRTGARDVFLDNQADVEYTKEQLRTAAAIAKRDGSAIAIGHPRPTTLAAVRELIPELQADGITFVLASEIAK
ncbi:MAG: hypothetical protein NVS2B17_11870 [Candidatus Velthaea sp.]